MKVEALTKEATKPLIKPSKQMISKLKKDKWCSWCVPSNLKAIEAYALRVTYSRDTRSGNFWEAIIYKNNQAVFAVENRGDGGSNRYYSINKLNWRLEVALFEQAAKEAYLNEKYEQDAIAISFLDAVAHS